MGQDSTSADASFSFWCSQALCECLCRLRQGAGGGRRLCSYFFSMSIFPHYIRISKFNMLIWRQMCVLCKLNFIITILRKLKETILFWIPLLGCYFGPPPCCSSRLCGASMRASPLMLFLTSAVLHWMSCFNVPAVLRVGAKPLGEWGMCKECLCGGWILFVCVCVFHLISGLTRLTYPPYMSFRISSRRDSCEGTLSCIVFMSIDIPCICYLRWRVIHWNL